MVDRMVVAGFAMILSLVFLIIGLLSIPYIILQTAIPCEPRSWLYSYTQMGNVVTFLVSAFFMERLKFAPQRGKFLLWLAIPASCFALHVFAVRWDNSAQQSCAAAKADS